MRSKKQFRPWLPGQPSLLPTDPRTWLPENHLVWFVLDIVGRLDLSSIVDRVRAKDPRGTQPHDPRMMMALLMYAYAVGVFSSRRIERGTYEDVAFRILTSDQHPDHATIARFRRENLEVFRDVFVQVLRIAAEMGLVTFGVLALDGVKILANASKHEAMSYDRMRKDVERLKAEIEALAARAEQTDRDEQARFGDGRMADLPEEIARREARKAKIEEAMVALEAESRQARIEELREQERHHLENAEDPTLDPGRRKGAATMARARRCAIEALESDGRTDNDDDDDGDDDASTDGAEGADGGLPAHRARHNTDGTPEDGAQRNFTDPDSKIMKRDGDHIVQAYNAQAVVDNANQIVVAAAVGNQPPDCEYLPPMLDKVDENLQAAGITRPDETPLAADAGYFSEANVNAAEERGFDPYIAPERTKRERPEILPVSESTPAEPSELKPRDKMRAKLKTPAGSRIYGLRKTTPEPVFGQIEEVRGFRRFLLRGLECVRGEWLLVTLTHNVLKMWRYEADIAVTT